MMGRMWDAMVESLIDITGYASSLPEMMGVSISAAA
jgi:hypothetical protein